MAEYIEREALLKAYLDFSIAKSKAAKARKGVAFFQGELYPMIEITEKEWIGLINAAPAADVEPVVRCKDCKHYESAPQRCVRTMYQPHCEPDDFCSYGERKDGEG